MMEKLVFLFFFIIILFGCAQDPKEKKPYVFKHPIFPVIDENEEETTSIEEFKKPIELALTELKKEALDSIVFSEENIEDIIGSVNPPQSAIELYEQTVTDIANDVLKTKYTRRELGLLQDEDLTLPPEEELYEFLSPEGEFLDKNKTVYEKLRNANPFHEQGVLARECGLQKVITADQEFSTTENESAQKAYEFAQSMLKIALGELPLDKTRDLYETCTGKDLLTGMLIVQASQ